MEDERLLYGVVIGHFRMKNFLKNLCLGLDIWVWQPVGVDSTHEPAQVGQAPVQRPELAAPHDQYNIFCAPFQGVSSLLFFRAVLRIKEFSS